MSPSPTPAPTLTVTVTATPPTPTVYVQQPDTGLDWIKDVWLGDFGGALTGAFIPIFATVLVTGWMLRRTRQAHDEDQRVANGSQLLDAVSAVYVAMSNYQPRPLVAATLHLSGWGVRLYGLYRHSQKHTEFADWIRHQCQTIHEKCHLLTTVKLGEDGHDPEWLNSHLDEIIDLLGLVDRSTIAWMADNGRWEPQTTRWHASTIAGGGQGDNQSASCGTVQGPGPTDPVR